MKQVLALVMLLSSVAHASPASEMCDGMKKSTPLQKWAYEVMLRNVWKDKVDCSVDGEYADRYDSPQLVRLAEVISSLGGYTAEDLRAGYGTLRNGNPYAIARLDRKQLDAETASMSAFAKARIAEAYDFAAAQIKVYEDWRATEMKGAGGKAIWKDGYAAAVAAELKENSADIALAIQAIEAAGDGKPCPDVLARFDALLSNAAPKSRDAAVELMKSSTAMELLWVAAGQCAVASDPQLAILLSEAGKAFNYSDRGIDGPSNRVAARIHHVFEATQQRRGVTEPPKGSNSDMLRLPLDRPQLKDFWLANAPISAGITPSFWGVVAANKPKGKGFVEISFKKNMQTSWNQACWDSNRISGIDSATGRVEYASDCNYTKGKKVNVAPYPIKIAERFAKSIKPGELVFFIELTNGQAGEPKATRIALPMDVYKSEKKDAPLVGLLGSHW
jgi:hypothetical protein